MNCLKLLFPLTTDDHDNIPRPQCTVRRGRATGTVVWIRQHSLHAAEQWASPSPPSAAADGTTTQHGFAIFSIFT